MVVAISIGLHVVAAIVAAGIVIARYFAPPPAVFESTPPKKIKLASPEREHKMSLAAFEEAASPAPSFSSPLTSTRVMDKGGIPPLPKLPLDQSLPLNASAVISEGILSLAGSGTGGQGLGAGGLGSGGGGGGGNGVSFFGLQATGRSILIVFDISTSVLTKANKTGVPVSKIKEETIALLEQLSINTSFGLIQFSRAYQYFQPSLLPPTDANKAGAKKWLETEFRTSGSLTGKAAIRKNPDGIESVLEAAYAMDPDVIYLISDGDFQRTTEGNQNVPYNDLRRLVDRLRQSRPTQPTQINFIGFEMKAQHKKEMENIVRRTGGQLREIKIK